MIPFLLVGAALAGEGTSLTVEEALQRALTESESVTISEAGVTRAEGEVWRARSGYLPSVNGAVSYTHTFLTEFEQIFARAAEDAPPVTTPGTTGGTGTIPPSDPTGGLSELPFGQDHNWRVEVTATQPIWSGHRTLGQTRMATASRDSAELALASTRATVALDAARAYYDAILADRLLRIAQETLTQAEATLADASLAHEVGRQPEFEVLRAQVEVENQRVQVIRSTRTRDTAHLRLKQLLELPADEPLVLATPLGDDVPADLGATAADLADVAAGRQRIVVRQAEESVRIAEASLMTTRSQHLPSLSANASLGFVSYPDTLAPPTALDEWYTNLSAGVRLNVPIFNGFRVRGEAMSARAGVVEARARLTQAAEQAALDDRDAAAELQAAIAQWQATSGTVAQAERAYAIAEVRYEEGLSTQSELTDARLLLESALANRAQAARDLQVARIRSALLPALPATAGMSTFAPGAVAPTTRF